MSQYRHTANPDMKANVIKLSIQEEKKRLDQQGDEEKKGKASTANVLRHDFRHQVYLTISTH